ncbi:MAG: cbb3-type cytochrome c oxidase subunit 3 [Gammaproteobacteria bacterium]|jgi:cytochrome c oxidase cbb3-type subunit 4
MDLTLFDSIWTVVVMLVFFGIVLWAWSGKRKQQFDEAANIPFREDVSAPTASTDKENSHG